MPQAINPTTLRLLRGQMSLQALATKSGVEKGTIHRIERGKGTSQRRTTIDRLSKALAVEPDVLLNEPTESLGARDDQLVESKLQWNVRVESFARNAMSLVAMRYKIPARQIVEAAPLLFALFMERSLQWRQANLTEIQFKFADLTELQEATPHVPQTPLRLAEAMANDERRSIEVRDYFAESFDQSERGEWEDDHGYDNNPVVAFLKKELAGLPLAAEIFHWSPYSGVRYHICSDEAAAFVGNDEGAIHAIQNGSAPLHEMPKALLEDGADPKERARWANEKSKAFTEDAMAAIHGLLDDASSRQGQEDAK